MDPATTQQQGIRLTSSSGRQLSVGPEAAQALARDALTRGRQILEEVQEIWSEIEPEQPINPQLYHNLKAKVDEFRFTVNTLTTFTPSSVDEAYWNQRGSQDFGPGGEQHQ